MALISNIELDIPVQQVNARDLTLDAAHKTERVQIAIEGAIQALLREGKKVTQNLVSALTAIPRGTIARYWCLFISLIDSTNSKMNNSKKVSNVDQERLVLASTVSSAEPSVAEGHQAIARVLNTLADLPIDELLPSLNEVFFDWLKPHEWSAVWEGVTASAQMAILQGLGLTLPERMLAGAGV